MTEIERKRALALAGCSFMPATFAKRFARDMAFRAQHEPEREISARQSATLERMAWRFRRQMPRDLVPASKPPEWQPEPKAPASRRAQARQEKAAAQLALI